MLAAKGGLWALGSTRQALLPGCSQASTSAAKYMRAFRNLHVPLCPPLNPTRPHLAWPARPVHAPVRNNSLPTRLRCCWSSTTGRWRTARAACGKTTTRGQAAAGAAASGTTRAEVAGAAAGEVRRAGGREGEGQAGRQAGGGGGKWRHGVVCVCVRACVCFALWWTACGNDCGFLECAHTQCGERQATPARPPSLR